MATDQRTLPAYISNDADFRTWGSGIAAQLVACGLVKTSDTGQIDWSTVARPAVASTPAGYEIYRFADSLQATSPVFIKLEYGSGQSVVDRPGLWVTTGTVTNGAGTLSGTLSTRSVLIASGSKTAGATLNSYCCGSVATGRIMLFNNVDPASGNFGLAFCVERFRDGTATTNGNGVSVMTWGFSRWYQVVPAAGIAATQVSGYFPVANSGGAIKSYGSDTVLFPVVVYCGRVYWSMNLGYMNVDFPAWVPITANHLGAVRTYMPVGTILQFGNAGDCQLLMLWQ